MILGGAWESAPLQGLVQRCTSPEDKGTVSHYARKENKTEGRGKEGKGSAGMQESKIDKKPSLRCRTTSRRRLIK
jgi:hypothetical protein